ncbi:hypothetical protein NZD89_04305 [Alicyclobacillus fastidiosus]|uniref:50S ribosomal protein L9 n=1 Tax=Alicyclobacillus fastidiosus TaxID=392011 RepID=A0ABY6ZIR9_9BACL|nr:hypothetical protein [Alicyclobacillus fastidiosus]WAH42670.1 hypothetical protein NZD89_04305 [Alicyclobacillus fastidiosus]GMA64551.1 hypothetical protein GCM10025859_49910 [Alicyclobacillus fastidiosus]
MQFNKDFWIGFATGAVVGAVGYRLYEQKSGQLNRLVQGSNNLHSSSGELSVEDLMLQKERLEDLIAEKQAAS